jgi:RHS repeat-associated protein
MARPAGRALIKKYSKKTYHNFSSSTWNKTTLDYTVSNINYDKNGNLLSMDQQGNVPGSGIQTIDQLRYNYEDNGQSNRLLKVGDAMPDYGTGDFVNTNGTANDYSYDANGNLASDANKEIDTIIYTHFDKPQEIRFKNGKSLEYSYDAAGGKVQELVRQPGLADKITDYIGGYVYENNSLQYIPTAEGRSVRTTVNDNFKEEYFVKDHLGNVRSTIDVTPTPLQVYLATYELASANLEGLLFEQVAEIREDNPSTTDTGNLKSGKLNGAYQRIGTSLLMHVMAGDEVELNVNTFYEGYDAQNDNPVSASDMLSSIIGTLTGGVGGFQGSEGHNTAMVQQLFTPENYVGVYDNITGGITDPDRPKAYLNYVLFDENMAINATFSSAFQARGNGSWEEIGTTAPIKIPANGYLAVYLSNRSQVTGCTGCGNVYFDQLQVRIQNGHLLEESHYYPFGLPMAGLSTETGSNTIRQRRKYQSNEYIKELGLNWMDFNARQYDPQLGRFLGVDPLAASGGQDMFSPYAAMGNAPESMVDPNGTLATYSSDGVRNDELSTYAKDYVAEGGSEELVILVMVTEAGVIVYGVAVWPELWR